MYDGLMICDCRPILYATSVNKSLAYYGDVLGFKIGWRWSDEKSSFLEEGDSLSEVGTAPVGRDKVQLMLVKQAQGQPGMWLHLDIESAEEVDALYAEWLGKGAFIVEAPSLRPWGLYEMRVRDPDAHTMRVSSPPHS